MSNLHRRLNRIISRSNQEWLRARLKKLKHVSAVVEDLAIGASHSDVEEVALLQNTVRDLTTKLQKALEQEK